MVVEEQIVAEPVVVVTDREWEEREVVCFISTVVEEPDCSYAFATRGCASRKLASRLFFLACRKFSNQPDSATDLITMGHFLGRTSRIERERAP